MTFSRWTRRRSLLGVACLVALWAAVIGAQEAKKPELSAEDRVPAAVRQAMQDRDYEKAVAAIDAVIGEKDAPADYLTYLKGRALHLAKKHDEAVAVFTRFAQQFPDSPWARRARFGRALALMGKGDFRAAEVIYRQEAAYLLSADRKQEIADIYLEFAHAYFKPEDEQTPPDYAKALNFFQQALKIGPTEEKRQDVELLIGECHQHLGQLDQAVAAYQAYLKKYPESRHDVEARFRLGETQLARGQLVEARRTWQDLLAIHAQDPSARIAEATFNLGQTFCMPAPNNDEELSRGVAALEAFVAKFGDHKLAPQAHLQIAQAYMHRGRFPEAVEALQAFLKDERYADSDEVPLARQALGRSFQLQKKFAEALAAWREYLAKHPAHQGWADVQRAIITTEYLTAEVQRQDKHYAQARKLWEAFLTDHPLDQRSARILYLFGHMNYLQEKWDAAIADWRRLVSKYPGTNESSQAQYMIAFTLETEQGKLEEALKEYKKLNWGNYAAAAQQKIAELTAKNMSIATQRVFRSNETPQVQISARNIEEVTVQAYKVDLETYFHKMHETLGVAALDIALIDPDHRATFKLPDYAEYKLIEAPIDVPLPGENAKAGVMAVTVNSKTLEATTLLVQSDLDIVVKSSRDEVFVYAQNLRTGDPWAGVKLLIAAGEQMIAEVQTGDDGVYQGSFEELKEAGDVRVFAVADGHVASNIISLDGIGVAQGLADRGYIYTDRPAYRAGQVVHVRGVLRRAVDDAYVVAADAKYTVDVYDSRNRLLWQKEVTLGQFGSFHANFQLPDTAVQGDYRLLVHDQDEHSYQGNFQVHEYQLEPVQLSVETERNIFYRGEKISGKIVARFYYGAPLVGREIRYQLGGGRVQTAKTNNEGEVPFELETRDLSEAQVVPLTVTLPERNLQTAKNLVLATQGFSIDVSTVRDVYLSGDTFEITVKANDAEGKPVARKLQLHVLRRTKVEGRRGEQLVETHELTTGEDGVARQVLELEEGGHYVLRALGTDRFENTIAGAAGVQISDENDDVRLRILAEQHTYKVGDTAEVSLHWREAPAAALVTFEGARVLDYRIVRLRKGANKLQLPMEAKLAPNFTLAVAVMTDARPAKGQDWGEVVRFHQASSPFTVQRDLRLKIETRRAEGAKGPVQPGEEVEVLLTATDAQGKPVEAEISLGLIEQSLLERFGENLPAIQDFFRGRARQSAFRTTSSIDFSYTPGTQPINPDLLEEEDRLALERDEALRLQAGGGNNLGAFFGGRGGDGGFGYGGQPGAAGPGGGAFGERHYDEAEQIADMPPGTPPPPNDPADMPSIRVRESAPGGTSAHPPGEYKPDANGDADFGGNDGLDRWHSFAGGKGHFGNGQAADFEAVLDLIKTNVAVDSWEDNATLLQADGTQRELNVRKLAGANREQIAAYFAQLGDVGGVVLPGAVSETGYWNPGVVTDAKGRATLKLTVPDRSTAWRLRAKAITAATLAGEATADLTASKQLFGQLKLPLAFTDGDRAEIQVSVHNDLLDDGEIQVTLKTTIGGKSTTEEKKLTVNRKGVHELRFNADVRRPADAEAGSPDVSATFELTVAAAEHTDTLTRTVPVHPDGMPVFLTASGSAQSNTTAFIEPPQDAPWEAPTLQIIVGPTVERSLLNIVLGPAPWCQLQTNRYASAGDTATSDLMAAIAVQQLLSTTRQSGGPEAAALDARIRSSVSLLVSSQQNDGGWSWTCRGNSNRFVSARALWALSLAKAEGYPVPDGAYNAAQRYVRGQVAATSNTDYESKAVLLHALAAAGQGDFTLANRLYRNRPALSEAGLAYLALALAEMDRGPMAAELLADVKAPENAAAPAKASSRALPWNRSQVETRALWALAAQRATPEAPLGKQLVDWLMAHRTGYRWSPEKATGPAALAVCRHFARNQFQGEHYQLEVFVNDVRAETLDIGDDAGTRVIDVPRKLLAEEGKQRIHFQLTGRGRYSYQCIYGGFVATDKLASTTEDWSVTRHYEPAPREVDGRPIPRGFGVLQGTYESFRNPLTQLPVGQRGEVELRFKRTKYGQENELDYLVITEPLPSGTTVIEQSVAGSFERFEVGPGEITFYVGNRNNGTIRYDVHGYLPGTYRAAPTVVRNAYRPDELAVAEPKQLAVLPLGAQSNDEYRLTPQELYELGKLRFAKKGYDAARQHLVELFTNWRLKPDVYKDTARMLLEVHLETGPAADVVKYFEINIEKWPEVEIPLRMITKVGAAYDEIGEYERSYLVYRAGVEGSFARESQVGGFLENQGEFLRSVSVMQRLLREYPPEPYVAAAAYALAQRVYAKAPEAAGDPELVEKRILRVDLVRRALQMLDNFVTAYPADPAADQAAFSMGIALLELEAYEQTIAACERYAERYPDSEFLDSYWYTIGYSHFALGQHAKALQMCEKVAEHKRTDERSGRELESQNKWRAIYIMGQVHHSLGEAAEAIREYSRVEDRFSDARQAIEYFAHKDIALPEVTTVEPGKPVEVELTYRNIPGCDTKVYRIDLMKFSLLKRSLGGITDINLAGIRPYHEATVQLGDGKDYRDRTRALKLPLKEEGAYLVVSRGGDLHASGLVLVTPLEVQVQEEVPSGRVRATVKDSVKDSYVHDVHVKVIGTRNADFIAGDTDLRGVFVADGVAGKATIVAQAEGGRYAFFRGETELGPPPTPQQAAPTAPQEDGGEQSGGKDGELLEGLLKGNSAIQQEQQQELQDLYENPSEGVGGGGFF